MSPPFFWGTLPQKKDFTLMTPMTNLMTMTTDRLALQDFESARQRVFWRDLVSLLTRKSNYPLSLNQVRGCLPLKQQHYQGLQIVPLSQIVGSEGRANDFDRAFFPRQERSRNRWMRIDQAYYQQVSLPPVELTKLGEMYFVSDGNHRVSVARTRGQEFIEAYVIEIELEPITEFNANSFDAARC
jgi:hypothetical protein